MKRSASAAVMIATFLLCAGGARAYDLNTVTLRGSLGAIEYRSFQGQRYQGFAWALVFQGNEVYDIAMRCPSVIACQELEPLFNCSPTTTTSTDPADPSGTVEHVECPAFTWNRCLIATGHLQNAPEPGSHYGILGVAEAIEPTKDSNCSPREARQ